MITSAIGNNFNIDELAAPAEGENDICWTQENESATVKRSFMSN